VAFGAEGTNQESKSSGGFFRNLLKRAETNLVESVNTNAPAGTNIISNPATVSTNATAHALNAFSNAQLDGAVRVAISNGLAHAVSMLGHTNGFLTNLNARIPLPAQLAKTEKTLRNLGQDAFVDEFVTTMNRAAERAVPLASTVFANSVSQMSLADARALLTSGSKTALTDFFRKTTTNELSEKFLPIVREATAQTGVTSAYKKMMGKLSFASSFLNDNAGDLDKYVTAKSLDGLFTMVAEEEKRIRENPQAQATQLLQKVFGALQK